MIAIVLPSHPDKGYETQITLSETGDPVRLWDIDVQSIVGIWRQRIPEMSREGVTTDEMLDELMDHENGTADHLVAALAQYAIGCGTTQAAVQRLWDRYRERHT